MHQLVEQLNDKQQSGEFLDRQERQRQIEELAKCVPRWLQVKFMPSFGKIVKWNNQAMNQFQVNQIIKEKAASLAEFYWTFFTKQMQRSFDCDMNGERTLLRLDDMWIDMRN